MLVRPAEIRQSQEPRLKKHTRPPGLYKQAECVPQITLLRAERIVALQQNPRTQRTHGSDANANRNRRIQNAAASCGDSTTANAIALLFALLGGFVASGYLSLCQRGRSVRIRQQKVALAGNNLHRSVGVANFKLSP